MQNFVLANISYGTLECVDPVPLSCTNCKVSTRVLHGVSQKCIPENNYHPKVRQKWLCIALLHSYITLGLHKDPMFSIHSQGRSLVVSLLPGNPPWQSDSVLS